MNGKLGSLAQVRAQLAVGDIVEHSPLGGLSAQLLPGVTPSWHLIETYPNNERKAAHHLIARRFGVFIPEIEETEVRRGRKVDIRRLMFTGYIFVFVWGVLQHQELIEAVPGVARVMMTVEGKPVTIADETIDEIRAVENGKRPLPYAAGLVDPPRRNKRWRRSLAKNARQDELDNQIVHVRSWSAFQDGLTTLDSEGRNQSLLHALGLSS